ncbi:hypothetical protein RND71_023329 [Anisodus tanguticus]|uniref:Uncharacterized protein n=1 Tax=Anisodus tanguticus TaxID=243964 RepID=A0AAE1RSE3_9SOLA|nr:hypothetical protein RND71_023329 [Anisodus tanguticus]
MATNQQGNFFSLNELPYLPHTTTNNSLSFPETNHHQIAPNEQINNNTTSLKCFQELSTILSNLTKTSRHSKVGEIGVRSRWWGIEYNMGGKAYTFGDVYNCKNLLLEVFTGKRSTDNMFVDRLTLHNFAKMDLPEIIVEVVDPANSYFCHNTWIETLA